MMRYRAITIQQPWAWAIASRLKRVENRPRELGYSLPVWYHHGAIVAVAELVDCVPVVQIAGDPFAAGPWCYVLANVRELPRPIPWRGQQGWFSVEIPSEKIQADKS